MRAETYLNAMLKARKQFFINDYLQCDVDEAVKRSTQARKFEAALRRKLAEQNEKITLLESVIDAQSQLLVAYRLGRRPPERVFTILANARERGIKI